MNKTKFFKVAGAAAMKAQQDKSFFDKVKAFPRLISAFRKKQYKPNTTNLIMGSLVLLYIISPIDLIPGIILDDIGVLLFGMKYFNNEIINFMTWEAIQNKYKDVEEATLIK